MHEYAGHAYMKLYSTLTIVQWLLFINVLREVVAWTIDRKPLTVASILLVAVSLIAIWVVARVKKTSDKEYREALREQHQKDMERINEQR